MKTFHLKSSLFTKPQLKRIAAVNRLTLFKTVMIQCHLDTQTTLMSFVESDHWCQTQN